MRERFKAQEEREVEKMTKIKLGGGKAAGKAASNGAAAAAADKTRFPYAFPDDVGSNNSGWVIRSVKDSGDVGETPPTKYDYLASAFR